MTREGQEDDWIALRIETAELRKRVKNQTSQISDLKQAVSQLGEGSDMGQDALGQDQGTGRGKAGPR